MQPNPDPFPPDATTTLRVLGPPRPHSLVVFGRGGVRTIEHPVTDVQHSALMVHQGYGDLVRTRPKILATRLLRLPEVVPPEQRGRSHVTVPLLRPDPPESPAYTTWTIAGAPLMVDQIDSDRAELSFKRSATADTREVTTLELLPVQWWHLVQALLSLDAWMHYLKRELDAFAQDVRRGTAAADDEMFRVVGAFLALERDDDRPRGRGAW